MTDPELASILAELHDMATREAALANSHAHKPTRQLAIEAAILRVADQAIRLTTPQGGDASPSDN